MTSLKKIKCEEKIDELSMTIRQLQSELLASQHAAQAQEEETHPGSLRRGNSMCETKTEFKSAQQNLEAAMAAFEPFKICEEAELQEHMDTGKKQMANNTHRKITGAEEPFNIHIMTSEQGKKQKMLFTIQ